mmetsp:Transcript_68346/g.154745  ORF Transcript_68346/g.154745 Transcript_68346/m.154745 type:complete len:229 (-) Transcript_68346:128-814(-)|eukprot:CAMPEP_0197888344 /NCGR_PEP_ID=MMETSP1439-20131203/21936_1 /TAXON_ID=66791 /ORGANISM="Gonyaulax spinifera, Strain CCMP409" /LENGTH=228 /DNA_ID=CAMNT_0043508251 /DNA_START=73 /DNA_END=759 /DNA_ORIENTATION=+
MANLSLVLGIAILIAVRAFRSDVDSTGGLVVIWADYDGCFDLLASPVTEEVQTQAVNKWKDKEHRASVAHTVAEAKNRLTAYLDHITKGADRVIIFSGSNRQSDMIETVNMEVNGNGNSQTQLRQFAKSKGWEFNDARLQEVWGDHNTHDKFSEKGSEYLKKMMAKNNWKHLKSRPGAHVYFFDDGYHYLKAVKNHVPIPSECNAQLTVVHFDWLAYCLEGKDLKAYH